MELSDYRTCRAVLRTIEADAHVQRMKGFIQHGTVSTYSHCLSVALCCCWLNRILRLRANPAILLIGAMLHDFYLYDWHRADGGTHNWHGFTHAAAAMRNARRYLNVSEDVQHVIWCHMWPLNIARVPRSREAWIVCVADKYVSLLETLFKRSRSKGGRQCG